MTARIVNAARLMCFTAIILLSFHLFADGIGPWDELGVPDGGLWHQRGMSFMLSKPIGCFAGCHVYTNLSGRVYQFNFKADMNMSERDSVACLQKTEAAFGSILKLTPFTPHKDSNPNRYLWSEECSILNYPGWSVRLYLEKNTNGVLVAKGSVWNAKLSVSCAR